MKTKVIGIMAFVCLMACALFACANCVNNDVKGNGKLETRVFNVSGFHAIDLSLPAKVEFYVSDRYSCDVTIDENLMDCLDIKTVKGELKLGLKNKFRGGFRPTRFVIEITAPSLDELEIAGSGDIMVLNEMNGNKMEIEIAGSGDVKFEKPAAFSELDIEVAGSGDVVFGQLVSDKVDVEIAGSGDVTLKGQMQRAEIEIAGSGDVVLDGIDGKIKYDILGSGDIYYSGSATVKGEKLGSGNIIRR